MDIINQLLQQVPMPRMVKVRQRFDAPEVLSVPVAVQEALMQAAVLNRISAGDRVAVAIGSRGVADIPIITRELVRMIKTAGGNPFIIPAMGSHGGATGEGQAEVLAQLGVTEQSVGAPIQSSMQVVEVGRLPSGLPVYTDRLAYEADKVIVVNRIKPHTAFRGPVESGLMKMITIGLGKQKGADAAHAYSFKYMAEHVPEMAKLVIAKVPVIFGLGIIENAYDRPAKITAVPAEHLAEEEPKLLLEAKALMPQIRFDPIDVLVVDEIGKEISGDGMDPNITGRYGTPYASGGPEVSRIVVLGLTKKTHGNANGIGLADMITRKAAGQVDPVKGYANALTSTVTSMIRLPMVLETKEQAIKAAIKTCNCSDMTKVRLVHIKNTLELKEIWISESLLPEALKRHDIEVLSEPFPLYYT